MVLAACVLTGHAWGQSVDPVLARGLHHSQQDRAMVETAIARTNRLIAKTGHRLRASWSEAVEPADRSVPVYGVAAPEGKAATPAAVPRGCTCVFVNPGLFASWLKTHSTGTGRLDLDPAYVLTFMLLHEVGHITQRSAAGEFSNGELSQLNIEPSIAKANEEEADDFAIALIREEIKQGVAGVAGCELRGDAAQQAGLEHAGLPYAR